MTTSQSEVDAKLRYWPKPRNVNDKKAAKITALENEDKEKSRKEVEEKAANEKKWQEREQEMLEDVYYVSAHTIGLFLEASLDKKTY